MDGDARRRFLEDYGRIRHAEGRGSEDSAWYRALPYRDLSGKNAGQWAIRGRSYRHFERRVLPAIEREAWCPLDILDLGAGNAWMSYRLRLRNHRPVATDIFDDPRDGLRAAERYGIPLDAVAAEFDCLPFRDGSFDLAIYNSSLHYSSDYQRTLSEVRRCLRPAGRIVIMDSPVYRRRQHGEWMRAERQQSFERQYGFRSEAQGSIEFLDEEMLDALARELGIRWRRSYPWYGWRWALRPWKARLAGRRPPSRFFILVGEPRP